MKALSFLPVFLFVISTGLSVSAAELSEIPDLVGNWTGTSTGHNAMDGYFYEGDFTYVFSVTDQNGRVFNGTLYVADINETTLYPYSGIISYDQKTLVITEYGTGMDTGYLISPEEMELILLVNEKNAFAVLCTLKKGTHP
jgi:hypothetical protein